MVGSLPQTRDIAAQTEAARARAMVYHILAEALAGPVPGIENSLLDAVTAGAQALDSPACRRAALALAELPVAGIDALGESYTDLTANPDRQPVPLYESLHRQGHLAGPITWEIEKHYQALGLALNPGELPDHASVELAFLGHLAAAEAEALAADNARLAAHLRREQRHFLHAHAGAWLPEVGVALAAADEAFYATVGSLLSGFLSEELTGRKRTSQTGARLPTLKNPATCTLCGLCVGSCLPGALQVAEGVTETALTLKPAQCTGCNRCVRTCPEGVLLLALGAKNGTGSQVLRQSPRAACPNCGCPTVSQAELDAVFARLQPDPAMQQRLRLCVECKS